MGKELFQERYVAFVDILGFSDIVKRMEREPHLYVTVKNILKDVSQQAREFPNYRRKQREKKIEARNQSSNDRVF